MGEMGAIDKRIKVIEFIESTNDGGAEAIVTKYATLLDKKRFDVKICILKDDGGTANGAILRENDIPLIKILPDWYYRTFKFITRHMKSYTRNILIPERLRKIILQEKPDVLHVHLNLLTYVEQMSDILKQTKILYTCWNEANVHLSGENTEQFLAASNLLKHNNFMLIAQTEKVCKDIKRMFGTEKAIVLNNPLDIDHFRNVETTCEDKRLELGIPVDKFVVGHVGRFVEAKNQEFIVKIFKKLIRKQPKAFMLFVSDSFSKKIAKLLDSDAETKGKYKIIVHRTDLNEIYRAMDVFLFPSLYEGFGMALAEAEISGLRCIASDRVPKEAFLTDKAISLPIDNEDLWVNAILDQNIKGHAYSCMEDFDANKIVKELEKIYANG